jgi:hypothetical protein
MQASEPLENQPDPLLAVKEDQFVGILRDAKTLPLEDLPFIVTRENIEIIPALSTLSRQMDAFMAMFDLIERESPDSAGEDLRLLLNCMQEFGAEPARVDVFDETFKRARTRPRRPFEEDRFADVRMLIRINPWKSKEYWGSQQQQQTRKDLIDLTTNLDLDPLRQEELTRDLFPELYQTMEPSLLFDMFDQRLAYARELPADSRNCAVLEAVTGAEHLPEGPDRLARYKTILHEVMPDFSTYIQCVIVERLSRASLMRLQSRVKGLDEVLEFDEVSSAAEKLPPNLEIARNLLLSASNLQEHPGDPIARSRRALDLASKIPPEELSPEIIYPVHNAARLFTKTERISTLRSWTDRSSRMKPKDRPKAVVNLLAAAVDISPILDEKHYIDIWSLASTLSHADRMEVKLNIHDPANIGVVYPSTYNQENEPALRRAAYRVSVLPLPYPKPSSDAYVVDNTLRAIVQSIRENSKRPIPEKRNW